MNPNKKVAQHNTFGNTLVPALGEYTTEMHAHAVEMVHNAVTQSGAQYVTELGAADPSEFAVPESPEYAIGRVSVTSQEKNNLTITSAEEWVKNFVKTDICLVAHSEIDGSTRQGEEYVWAPIPLEDPFLAANRDDIIIEAINTLRMTPDFRLIELIDTLSAGSGISDEALNEIATSNPQFIITHRNLFPSFRFGREHIDALNNNISYPEGLDKIMGNWKLIKPDCLQYAADKAMERGVAYAERFIIKQFPDTITIPEDFVMQIADKLPYLVVDLITHNRFPEMKSNVRLIRKLCERGYSREATHIVGQDLLRTLSFAEISTLFGGVINCAIVKKLIEQGRMNNEEDLLELLNYTNVVNLLTGVGELPSFIQSYVFKETTTLPNGQSWVHNAKRFTHLKDDDYIFMIDHVDDLLADELSLAQVRDIFLGAEGEARYRFEHDVEPRFIAIQDAADLVRDKNTRRTERRQSEEGYFNAGNININTYDYEGPLSDIEIAEALENEHCVRQAGVLRDIANDTTRVNRITCVDSPLELDTSDLGAEVKPEDRVICTEHGALLQLLDYLQKAKQTRPDNLFFDDVANNLSFIGEKEYAEAVRGIAVYWKWFLDQDSSNQLYIDTIVSDLDGSTKSDVYMFDRILEHFSTDDMERYQGRLLTKGADITQDDPRKVKVVLLDDWTISGAQLRSGYNAFFRRNPTLMHSIEVQLIAASPERVGMGIEALSSYDVFSRTMENDIPLVTRAYYLAHKAEIDTTDAKGSRITGAHSSVDYGFATDIGQHKDEDQNYPLLASVVRPYRQLKYKPENINRLLAVMHQDKTMGTAG